ncbi:MAG: homoserine dehydrogenase [Lentisphaeria bacterium]|nr:homoserine dehydrogenase [Lentisphaeria bacterium]NQZ69547.1 homoserine dehydrogenase [Lentisphaeria bacterium]
MSELNIAILGYGTVGTGVAKCLLENQDIMHARTGVKLVLKYIADIDTERDRGLELPDGVLVNDANAVINDPDVDVVVELIGGKGIAKEFTLAALKQGKAVVTANKALLAYHGKEIFDCARENNTEIFFEASVAGGIPILKALKEGLAANHINSIYGILNGTCNYILTRMENEQINFEPVLKEAQELGYAEAEPTLDVAGDDAAHKTVILASLAFGKWFDMSLHIEGIEELSLLDISNADKLGYRIKLLGIIKREGKDIQMRVHPALIPKDTLLAQVNDVFNAVLINGDFVGDTMYYGRGAGMEATASAVTADIIDACLNRKHDSINRVAPFTQYDYYGELVDISDIKSRYYIRLELIDKAGCLAAIASEFAAREISISTVNQDESDSSTVPVVLTTALAIEKDMKAALEAISKLDFVKSEPVMIRIEDLHEE